MPADNLINFPLFVDRVAKLRNYESEYLGKLLVSPGLVVIFVDIKQLLFPTVTRIHILRMLMGYELVRFGGNEKSWDCDI